MTTSTPERPTGDPADWPVADPPDEQIPHDDDIEAVPLSPVPEEDVPERATGDTQDELQGRPVTQGRPGQGSESA